MSLYRHSVTALRVVAILWIIVLLVVVAGAVVLSLAYERGAAF